MSGTRVCAETDLRGSNEARPKSPAVNRQPTITTSSALGLSTLLSSGRSQAWALCCSYMRRCSKVARCCGFGVRGRIIDRLSELQHARAIALFVALCVLPSQLLQ
jgi:hypothetical protein